MIWIFSVGLAKVDDVAGDGELDSSFYGGERRVEGAGVGVGAEDLGGSEFGLGLRGGGQDR